VNEKYNTLDQHLNYLEHSFSKIGNQISLKAIGYYRVDTQKDMNPKAPSHNRVMLVLDVTNHGLSDQIVDNIALSYQTSYFSTPELMNNGI
jgi:hypothetical protein